MTRSARPSKSSTFRVASAAPCVRTIAAICASAIEIGRPSRSRSATTSAVGARRRDVEGQDPVSERGEELGDRVAQPVLASARVEPFDAVGDLGHRDRRGVELGCGLSRDPVTDRGVVATAGDSSDSTFASALRSRGQVHVSRRFRCGAGLRARSTGPPSRSPTSSRARPRWCSSSDRTASSRIARISASSDRPCSAARTRRRCLVVSSRFRVLTAAMGCPCALDAISDCHDSVAALRDGRPATPLAPEPLVERQPGHRAGPGCAPSPGTRRARAPPRGAPGPTGSARPAARRRGPPGRPAGRARARPPLPRRPAGRSRAGRSASTPAGVWTSATVWLRGSRASTRCGPRRASRSSGSYGQPAMNRSRFRRAVTQVLVQVEGPPRARRVPPASALLRERVVEGIVPRRLADPQPPMPVGEVLGDHRWRSPKVNIRRVSSRASAVRPAPTSSSRLCPPSPSARRRTTAAMRSRLR